MKLYYMPGACSLSPHIVAQEAGIDIQLVKIENGKLPDGSDFKSINPKGYVPVLGLDDGQILTEGPAIVQYLADQKPDSGLAPEAGSLERYRLQEWLNFISTELHKQFGPLFRNGSEDAKKTSQENLTKRYNFINERLGQKPFLLGEHFSAADAYLFTVTNWLGKVGIKLDPWPNVADFYKRVGERPKVMEALKAEGLLTAAK